MEHQQKQINNNAKKNEGGNEEEEVMEMNQEQKGEDNLEENATGNGGENAAGILLLGRKRKRCRSESSSGMEEEKCHHQLDGKKMMKAHCKWNEEEAIEGERKLDNNKRNRFISREKMELKMAQLKSEMEQKIAAMQLGNNQLREENNKVKTENNELKEELAKKNQLMAIGEKGTKQLMAQMAKLEVEITQMRSDYMEFGGMGENEFKEDKNAILLAKKQMDVLCQQIASFHAEITKIGEAKMESMNMLAETKAGLTAYRKRNAEYLLAVQQAKDEYLLRVQQAKERQLFLNGLKQEIVRMARKHNMDEESRPVGSEEDNVQMLFWMPLELHCELFAWLPFQCRLRLVPTLCRGIWAVKGREVRRKWESMNKWWHWDASRIEISGWTAKYINETFGCATVRARNPFPTEIFNCHGQCALRRIYYFEVTIVNIVNEEYHFIKIGLCDANFPLRGELVGKVANSFGISSGGGLCIEGHWNINDNWKFGKGDVIGCGMELFDNNNGQCRQMFFTKNGTILVKPFPFPLHANNVELFPAVTLWCKGHEIQANFGHEPFEYDLTQHPTTN